MLCTYGVFATMVGAGMNLVRKSIAASYYHGASRICLLLKQGGHALTWCVALSAFCASVMAICQATPAQVCMHESTTAYYHEHVS